MGSANQKRILLAPLDWGMGHATRCIPIARELTRQGAEVILAGTNESRKRILDAVPGLDEIELPAYGIRYSKILPAWLKIALQYPQVSKIIREENRILKSVVEAKRINGILSDNRYGVYHRQIPSALITHQLHLQLPAFLKYFSFIPEYKINSLLKPFNEIWLPDSDGEISLSGKLSFPLPIGKTARKTGLLSRFESFLPIERDHTFSYDLLVIVSGPEPQNRVFFEKAKLFADRNNLNASFILPFNAEKKETHFSNPTDALFTELISKSRNIICRPGYSTLMDLLALNRKAVLVPTPGQTEQEYLAEHAEKSFGFSRIQQSRLSKAGSELLMQKEFFNPPRHPETLPGALTGVIHSFLSSIH